MPKEQYQPQDSYESDVARIILAEAWRTGPDVVDGVAGVRTVTPYDERPDGEDCEMYVFGDYQDALVATQDVILGWKEHSEPIPGAIALYFSEDHPMHVGRVVENGNVISKWTTDLFESGHVYEHLPLAVPRDYGNRLVFYTEE